MTNTRIVFKVLATTILALCGVWICYSQPQVPTQDLTTPKKGRPFNTIKIADDLYVIDGGGCNVAVYITDEGVLLADDKYEYHYDELMADIRKLTRQPVKYVINTHYHADHSGGNTHFAPAGAIIISTLRGRENILNKVQPGMPLSMIPATVTFNDEIQVFLGGKEVRAFHYGPGHTGTDAVVYFPEHNFVHMGDLIHIGDLNVGGGAPLIDYNGGGTLNGWIQTLDSVAATLKIDSVVPGHGPVGKKSDIIAYRNLLEGVRENVSAVVRQGKTEEEVKAYLVNDLHWQPNGLSMIRSLHGMMTELR
jgi:cyclase